MLLIKNVRLYSEEEEPQDILCCGKDIIAIGKDINCSLPIDVTVDGGGKVAIPGYIDMHVHVTGGGGEGGFANQVPPLRLSELIRAGETTVVGLLGTDGTTRCVENLLAKTKSYNEEGWTAYCLTGSYELPSPTITGSVTKDIALISEIIGVKVCISDHRSSAPTEQELIRLATEARMGGLLSNKPGVMHMHVGKGRDELRTIIDIVKNTEIPVSVFRPTHMGRHPEQGAEFAKLGGYVDFTSGDYPETAAKQIIEAMKGIPFEQMTLSSDGNGSMPKWNEKHELIGISAGKVSSNHEVIRCLVRNHGFRLSEAIKLLTENPAKSLNMYPYKGLLAKGSCADVLLLDQELNIDTVVANGKLFLENKELKYIPRFE